MDAMGGIMTDDSWRNKERKRSKDGTKYLPRQAVNYSGAFVSANVKESALGVSGTTSTRTPILSSRKSLVVGPIAATRARRTSFFFSFMSEDSLISKEKCMHSAGITCAAEDGAKNAIHHGSQSSS